MIMKLVFVTGNSGLSDEGEDGSAGNLDDALADPCGELGAERDLGGLIALPAGVVGPARGEQREAGFGHDVLALHDGTGDSA
jgi:hypothetical protein